MTTDKRRSDRLCHLDDVRRNIAVVSTSGGQAERAWALWAAARNALAVGSVSINASYTENGVTKAGSAPLTVNTVSITEFHITPTLRPSTWRSATPAVPGHGYLLRQHRRTVTASTDWTVIGRRGGGHIRLRCHHRPRHGADAGTTTITGTFQGARIPPPDGVRGDADRARCDAHQSHHASRYQPALRGVVTLGDNYTQTVTTSAIWTSSDNTVVAVGATTGWPRRSRVVAR